jgi:hypothetical protein
MNNVMNFHFPLCGDNLKPWSKTTLNYRMMLERYPNLKEEVGGLIPNYEISSLDLTRKLAE